MSLLHQCARAVQWAWGAAVTRLAETGRSRSGIARQNVDGSEPGSQDQSERRPHDGSRQALPRIGFENAGDQKLHRQHGSRCGKCRGRQQVKSGAGGDDARLQAERDGESRGECADGKRRRQQLKWRGLHTRDIRPVAVVPLPLRIDQPRGSQDECERWNHGGRGEIRKQDTGRSEPHCDPRGTQCDLPPVLRSGSRECGTDSEGDGGTDGPRERGIEDSFADHRHGRFVPQARSHRSAPDDRAGTGQP